MQLGLVFYLNFYRDCSPSAILTINVVQATFFTHTSVAENFSSFSILRNQTDWSHHILYFDYYIANKYEISDAPVLFQHRLFVPQRRWWPIEIQRCGTDKKGACWGYNIARVFTALAFMEEQETHLADWFPAWIQAIHQGIRAIESTLVQMVSWDSAGFFKIIFS